MGIKANMSGFEHSVEQQREGLYERIVEAFIRAGENFVTQARDQVQDHALGTYLDQTTNLRNSIGYFIFVDGQLLHENSTHEENRAEVQELVKPKGIQLIGIAGMNYASFVEAKGYNVISMQAETCYLNLESYLETIEAVEKSHNTKVAEAFAAGTDNYDAGL
jgi:hypothetical protein